MKTYIDYYFNPSSWIIPENISLGNTKVKNSGLRIRADFLKRDSFRRWNFGHHEDWNCLGVVMDDGSLLRISIETENLFKIISFSGVEDGFLRGTYRLIKIKNQIYRLIPENSRENEIKTEISRAHNDSSVKFTSKMIPGHLYVSKVGKLFLCLENEIKCYQDNSAYYGLAIFPETIKLLCPITPESLHFIDIYSPKTTEDFIEKVFLNLRYIENYEYSKNYVGKDLGKLLQEGEFINKILLSSDLPKVDTRLLLCGELWRTKKKIRDELRRRMPQDPPFQTPGYERLLNELRSDIHCL